jgi:hypothetical protein
MFFLEFHLQSPVFHLVFLYHSQCVLKSKMRAKKKRGSGEETHTMARITLKNTLLSTWFAPLSHTCLLAAYAFPGNLKKKATKAWHTTRDEIKSFSLVVIYV